MSLLDVINIPTFNLNILISNPFSSNNFISLGIPGFIFTDTRRSKINILLYALLNSIGFKEFHCFINGLLMLGK